MGSSPNVVRRPWLTALGNRLAHVQHRTASYLILSNLIAAATGLLFWLLLTRMGGLPASEIGIGYAIVGIGATVAIVAKGGFDTSLVRTVPTASRDDAEKLLRFAIALAAGAALVISLILALIATNTGFLLAIGPLGWTLAGAIAILMVVTWLQDAYFLAEGDAAFIVKRNLVLSASRILLPLPVIAIGWYQPVATTWLLALAFSALVALVLKRHIAQRAGRKVPRFEFLKRSFRNQPGSAVEFLPGLLLAPLVLVVDGPAPAGHFAMAWTAASLLFVMSAAIGRTALAEIVQHGAAAAAIRKGFWQHVATVAPAALLGVLFAPWIMAVFGRQYAVEAATTFALLCTSILFVAPFYLYLSVLRADDRNGPLLIIPILLVVTLVVLAPLLGMRYGLAGVAAAWLLANAPFGLLSAWRLGILAREVTPHRFAPSIRRGTHAE